MTNTRARELIDSGYRMPAPDGTPDEIYQLMLRYIALILNHCNSFGIGETHLVLIFV